MATWEQHKLYRGKLLPAMADHCGYGDPLECHYDLKVRHIPFALWDQEKLKPPSTAVLSIEQMSDFLRRVFEHAMDYGVQLDPLDADDRVAFHQEG